MKEIRETLKKSVKVNRGLCTTCNNVPTCMYYQSNGGRIVWYCETFDDYVEVQESFPITEKKVESTTKKPAKRIFEGLCVNCANCATCTFTKPEGGIWHCEEYE